MNKLKASVLAAAVLFGVAVTADAFAQRRHGGGGGGAHRHHHHGHHGHHRGSVSLGFAFGSPFWYGYGWPYYAPSYRPYYYPYPVAAGVAAGPPVYVEQGQSAPATTSAPAAGYWYYCSDSQAYYPHVQQCSVPWERVAPQPPS